MKFTFRSLAVLCCVCTFSGVSAAQAVTAPAGAPEIPRQASAPVPAAAPAIQAPGLARNPFAGGVPSGQPAPGVMPLSLADAIGRGLRQNLGVLLGEQATRSAEAARRRSLSNLLPNITTSTSESTQQINLKAFGFPGLPGINPIVGPFNILDARVFLSQQVLNFNAIQDARSGSENLKAARHSYQDARDIVVLAVATLYLQAVAGQARIAAAEAQVNTAQALYNRAVDLKNAGMVPGIDVLRAQVELQAQQQRLIFFQNEFEKQKLNLARAIGLPIGQQFTLTDQVPYSPPPPITFEQALDQAYKARADYLSAQALVSAAQAARRAADAERLPSLAFDGNYGAIGPRLWGAHGTFTAAASLRVPIFQAGRVRADVLQADALLQQRRSELEDLRTGINYDLRTAFLDLKASGDQVQVARSTLDLAGQQLRQAQDRFSAGVANHIEVVQAQEAVATANENYISGLFAYNLAKAELARAIGGAEELSRKFFGTTP